ncbi:hypothetical protein P4O66_005649 [Electrophorus voltai]|uniref:Uncharacterized protein n=1 Tax=Electrophorus voltai TaxID=2609070 RepID=A0AAD8ZJW0_9TELE|nr:hypothetical protein P4O66_005649 [Electrophorus voltai]
MCESPPESAVCESLPQRVQSFMVDGDCLDARAVSPLPTQGAKRGVADRASNQMAVSEVPGCIGSAALSAQRPPLSRKKRLRCSVCRLSKEGVASGSGLAPLWAWTEKAQHQLSISWTGAGGGVGVDMRENTVWSTESSFWEGAEGEGLVCAAGGHVLQHKLFGLFPELLSDLCPATQDRDGEEGRESASLRQTETL